MAATAGVRSDLAAVEAAAEERRKLHDAFKRQWNEDDIIQVRNRATSICFTLAKTLMQHFINAAKSSGTFWRSGC